jgi:hypothetical protein
MGDLGYNEIFGHGAQKKQHLAISLKHYSEALVEYESIKENEALAQKSYTNNWKKVEIHNAIGEPTNRYLYRQTSTCINRKDLKIRTICNYALHDLCFSLHVDESNNMVKMLSQKHNNYNKVIVKLVSKNFTYNCVGEAGYYGQSCKYPIVSIPLDVVSRYLQKSEEWTCTLFFWNDYFEFKLTGNLPTAWSQ